MARKIKDENGKTYYEKKPFYKRIWFILLIVIVLVVIVAEIGKNNTDPSKTNNSNLESSNSEQQSQETTKENTITYTKVDAAKMIEELDDNALKAEKTYKDQYVEVTGSVYNIDSSGKYISIRGTDGKVTFTGITCYLKTEDHKNTVMELSKGQTVVVKGKVTGVGEVLGYSVDIDEISAK